MKPEIEKILVMHKSGSLTSEQASQLLEELQDDPFEQVKSKAREKSFGEKVLDSITQIVGGIHDHHHSGNVSHASHIEGLEGNQYTFENNHITGAHVHGIRLDRSELTDNKITRSHFQNFHITDGALNDSLFANCHLQRLKIDHGEMKSVEVKATHFQDLSLLNTSQIVRSQFYGVSITDFALEQSEIENTEWFGVAAKDCRFLGSSWMDVICKTTKFKSFLMNQSHFTDVIFTGENKWKRSTFKNVQFENCHLKKVLFQSCKLEKVEFKNLSLENIQLKDLSLSNITIDGNEAFFKLIQEKGN